MRAPPTAVIRIVKGNARRGWRDRTTKFPADKVKHLLCLVQRYSHRHSPTRALGCRRCQCFCRGKVWQRANVNDLVFVRRLGNRDWCAAISRRLQDLQQLVEIGIGTPEKMPRVRDNQFDLDVATSFRLDITNPNREWRE